MKGAGSSLPEEDQRKHALETARIRQHGAGVRVRRP